MSDKKLGLTPREIVSELDKHIIGQNDAKKAVAIALRNRYRRKNVSDDLREEISPKNILMIGPTGVGKTEIARRLAKLSGSPFIKVEATKFTEVGYVGRDVESIIRDLVDSAVTNFKIAAKKEVKEVALKKAISKILDSLVGKTSTQETRDRFREKIESGELDNTEIEIEIQDQAGQGSSFDIMGIPGATMGVLNMSDMVNKALGVTKSKLKKLLVKDALLTLTAEEAEKLIDEEAIIYQALRDVENDGIVFLDEIDKITSKSSEGSGGRAEVSREGVQRDLLPIVEGTTVSTKHGFVKTNHILFIASGAFHMSKPSDLLPELQGRFPIRVELKPLTKVEFTRILTEPESSLIKQYTALLKTENIDLEFTSDAIDEISDIAEHLNAEIENIGARRLHTLIEKLLEDISFTADSRKDEKIIIDAKYVNDQLSSIKKNIDLSKYIL